MGSFILGIILIGIAYTLGSLCSAILVSKAFSLPDPRVEGSQNPGATNVLRLAGKKYAAYVLAGDFLKGLLPVGLAHLLGAGPGLLSLTCLAAVIGHVYPVFFDFKGGKGVATALGGLMGLHFLLGVVVIACWLLVAKFSRYSSLAAIVSFVLAPFFSIAAFHGLYAFLPLALMSALILYQHRKNIARLSDGTEPQIAMKNPKLTDVAEELFSEPQDITPDKASEAPASPEPVVVPEPEPEPKPKKSKKSEEP